MRPIYRKTVYPDYTHYYLGLVKGNQGWEADVYATQVDYGIAMRAEVARMLRAVRVDMRNKANSPETAKTSNAA